MERRRSDSLLHVKPLRKREASGLAPAMLTVLSKPVVLAKTLLTLKVGPLGECLDY